MSCECDRAHGREKEAVGTHLTISEALQLLQGMMLSKQGEH